MNRPSPTTGKLGDQQTGYTTQTNYWPHGAVSNYWYGNAVAPVYAYNSRLQMSSSWATVGNDSDHFLLNIVPDWGSTNNNGNLQGTSEGYGASVPWASLTWLVQTYTYDNVNRLRSVSDTGYSRSFCSDAYGNTWVNGYSVIAPAGNTPQMLGSTCPNSTTPYNAKNQINGASYDLAGNHTLVNGNALAYDAENRLLSATEPPASGGATETYLYDGDGKRVEKVGPGGTIVYVYDALGELAAEYSTTTSSFPCATCYLSADHLRSTRLVTDASVNVIARHDFLPFGEEILANMAGRNSQWGPDNDTVNQKFTAKERDQETGLDYFGARYYGSALGRFTSPDPIGIIKQKLFDPQQWNAYSYARNNPLRFMDPTGQYVTNCASDDKKCNKAVDQFEKQRQKDLQSKDANVRAAAAAFGDRDKDNGVHVGFADLASQGLKGEVDISKSGNGKTDVEVTLDYGVKGKSLQETIAHEGTHVLTDMNFLDSYDKATSMYNGLLNVTHGETEAWAYQAGAAVTREHGFGPNDTEQIQEFLRTNPTYAPILNVPSFPNNPQFPQTNDPLSPVPFQ